LLYSDLKKTYLLTTKKLFKKKEMKNNKKAYLAPMVEVMNARVEKGFAGSGNTPSGNTGDSQILPPTGISMSMNTRMEDFD
jgi:hypothetical protein